MSDTGSGIEPSPMQNVTAQYVKIQRQYQQILDRWTPHMLQRWLATAGLLALFFLRIVLAQGVSPFFYLYLCRALNVILMRRLVVHWSVLIFWVVSSHADALLIILVCCTLLSFLISVSFMQTIYVRHV